MPAHHLESATINWPHPDRGPFEILFEWAEIDGVSEVVGFEMRSFVAGARRAPLTPLRSPFEGGSLEPIRADRLRTVPFRRLVDQALKNMRVFDEFVAASTTDPESTRKAMALLFPHKLPGSTTSEKQLRQVADTYRAAQRRGDPPRAAVAEKFRLSSAMAAKRIGQARNEGLLERTTKGRTSLPSKKTTATPTTRKKGKK